MEHQLTSIRHFCVEGSVFIATLYIPLLLPRFAIFFPPYTSASGSTTRIKSLAVYFFPFACSSDNLVSIGNELVRTFVAV